MTTIQQFSEKVNVILEAFDRMIINRYNLQLYKYRQFMYYLIENGVKLVDFKAFAQKQTEILCSHIDGYIKETG